MAGGIRRRGAGQVAGVGLLMVLALSLGAASARAQGEPAATGPGDAADTTETRAWSQTIPGSVAVIDMRAVPGGTVRVPGSPRDVSGAGSGSGEEATMNGQATVEVAPFWISAIEIPWEAFDPFVFEKDREELQVGEAVDAVARPSHPYVLADRGFGHDGYPAISISADSAAAWADWLSAHTGLRWRLPTEAEWLLICRDGGYPQPAADGDVSLADFAWYRDNANWKTHPCGEKRADRFGIHDLFGNAGEWALTADGAALMLGGSYLDRIDAIGCASREEQTAAWNASDPQIPKSPWWLADGPFAGFRVVCEERPAR